MNILSRPTASRSIHWLRQVDVWELLTGLFVIVAVTVATDSRFAEYAKMLVVTMFYSEFAANLGLAFITVKSPTHRGGRVARIGFVFVAEAVLMSALALSDPEPAKLLPAIPQSLWILYGRLRPHRGQSFFGEENFARFSRSLRTTGGLLLAQFIGGCVLAFLLAAVGVVPRQGNTVTVPDWLSALIFGAYYIELAFILPRVERDPAEPSLRQ